MDLIGSFDGEPPVHWPSGPGLPFRHLNQGMGQIEAEDSKLEVVRVLEYPIDERDSQYIHSTSTLLLCLDY